MSDTNMSDTVSEGPDQEVEAPGRIANPAEVADTLSVFTDSIDDFAGSNYVAPAAPGHDVHGLWHCFDAHSRSGYTCHAVALSWMLQHGLDIRSQLVPHRALDIEVDRFPKDRYDMLFEWTKDAVGHAHLMFASFPPEVAKGLQGSGPPIVPYCAFEGDRVSAFTRRLVNDPHLFKEVWVVSDSVRRSMLAGGVEKNRVRVVRPMLWGGPWEGMGIPMNILEDMAGNEPPVDSDAPFVFGAMGTWHERKGWDDLLRAYFSKFSRKDPVVLRIKTSAFGSEETVRRFTDKVIADIADIAREFGDHGFPESKRQARIQLVTGTGATDADVIEWLGGLDCYANSTYGEGLGIPHVWAKCQGVPMISSTYGAVPEMLREIHDVAPGTDILVPHELATVHPELPRIALMFDADAKWGIYDVDAFADAMWAAYVQKRRVDTAGAKAARSMFSMEQTIGAVRDGLDELIGPDVVKQWRRA